MKKSLRAISIIVAMLMLVACSNNNGATADNTAEKDDDYKLVLRMSHVFAPNEQLTISTDAAAEAIYERTNGAIEIQSYPQGQLAVYKDSLEQVYNGAEFIAVEDPTYLGDYVPDFNAIVGPFLYDDFDDYYKVIESDLVKDLIQEIEEDHGIKVLGLDYIFGFRNMMTNKLINTPADMKGLKIRVPGSQIFIDTINAMGATATPMAFGETLSAVQQGVVDGLEGTVDAMTANGSAEVVSNVAFTKHFLGTCGVYINADLFNSIPEEYQVIIEEEFAKHGKLMSETVQNNFEEQKKELEEKGIEFNEVDSDSFRELASQVFDKMDGISDGILQEIQEIINN